MTARELTKRRKAAGMSQEELAVALGVSWSAVYSWEHGDRPIRAPMERLIERIFAEKKEQKTP